MLYNGVSTSGHLLSELSGLQTPANVSSCRNEMHVVFSSDSSKNEAGYNATIHVNEDPYYIEAGQSGYCRHSCPCGANEGHCQSHDQCLFSHFCLLESCPPDLGFANTTSCCQDSMTCGIADLKTGLIVSPNFPQNYQNNMQCAHQISTEPGKIITIEFESFNVSIF